MGYFPEELLRKLQAIEGFDEKAFMDAHMKDAVTSIRVHPIKSPIPNAISNSRIKWCREGYYLDARPVFTLDPYYHAGAYYVQEASSMFLDHMLRELLPGNKNLRVLDLCAAPGGKSTLIASWLDASSLLLSNEVIRSRAAILEENLTRWGYMNTWVSSNDPKEFGKLLGYFDIVVVDAPCSGSGLFRKDKNALKEWSEANVQLCSERQKRILADVWPALKENGILIYATCSYSPEENEEILDWLAEEKEIETLAVNIQAEWGIIEVSTVKSGIKAYRFFPDKVKGEGFFIAAIRKKEASEKCRLPKFKSMNDKVAEQGKVYFEGGHLRYLKTGEGHYNAICESHEVDWHLLKAYLFLRKTGIEMGEPANKDWIPSHELAMSVNLGANVKSIDLDKTEALRFLKKEELLLPTNEKGWHIVSYKGLSLGWVKHLGNRVNNYLPKHWRIRMEIPDEGI